MKRPAKIAWYIAITVSVATDSLSAQGGNDPSRAEARDCAHATRIVEKGHPEKKEAWAYAVIAGCKAGATTLAALWQSPPSDTAALSQLEWASRRIADRALLDAALNAARASANTQTVRRAAINVALGQYNPTLRITDAAWADPDNSLIAITGHSQTVAGTTAVTTSDEQRLIAAFQAMANGEPDPKIAKIARMIVRHLCPSGC